MTSEEIYKQQLSDLATAINNKTNSTSAMTVAQMTAAVNSITVGGELQDKTVTPSTSQQVITADSNYDGLGTVTVEAIQTETKDVALSMASGNQVISATSGKYMTSVTVTKPSTLVSGNIKSGVSIGGISGTYIGTLQAKTITPSRGSVIVKPDTNYTGLSQVTVVGDADLLAANIKDGINIFGVAGTLKSEQETIDTIWNGTYGD